mmetsp:Transcript_4299/g.6363  ORF Transcript_4299/g.6363 Transcript_4299/m.6363 type:complete len:175 (+) Transcript_4299:154-678(+)|eukprot:CAMPEP_0203764678 /NCGR_PEP_ID=MMETSP0098-20131031/17977_1 /ASSEMBLY_ACC=CAM_ASM_000208 /TAXON_ID=96639 /ORGANISM=" , Strain NY0313808BC1" /LENGTH=174 /DNA_ID=CAMNT_0050660825 /DNA_START=156 /DNA_END=680 /DNA_ORIENTATION=+
MSKLPAEIDGVLNRFDKALTNIEKKLEPFTDTPVKEIEQKLKATEKAKLNLVYSYTLNSLFYMYLKIQGVSPQNHPVRRELDRVKRQMVKTVKLEKQLESKSAKNESESKGDVSESPVKRKRPLDTETPEEDTDKSPKTPASKSPGDTTTSNKKRTSKKSNTSKGSRKKSRSRK